jgi:endonuclease YncB( thermonuclease family)
MLKSLCIALHLCSTVSGHARVIDGDTIVVEGIHVRIFGLDAEELNESFGKIAKGYMEYLTRNQEVACKLTGDRSYDRYIGVCAISGSDLAKNMVAAGMALDCARYSGGRYRQYELPKAREFLIQKGYCQ